MNDTVLNTELVEEIKDFLIAITCMEDEFITNKVVITAENLLKKLNDR